MKKLLSVAAPIAGYALGGVGGALVGGAIGSGLAGDDSAKRAAQAQSQAVDRSSAAQLQAQREANKLQMDMFNRGIELNQPFYNAGVSGLQGLQQAANQQASPFSFDYQGYFNSPEYAALSQQAQKQALAGQAATGGLRSGGSQVALSAIAPQLAQQARGNAMNEYSLNQAAQMDRYNRLMGLVGVGQGSAQQSASQAGQVGSNLAQGALQTGQGLANNQMQMGNISANRYAAQNQALQGILGAGTTALIGNNMGLFNNNQTWSF